MPKGVYQRTDPEKTLVLLGALCWLKQEFETDTAYDRFGIYRDLGPDRTLEKARERLGKKPSYAAQLQTWSRRNMWVKRAEAFDAEQDRVRLEAEQKVLIEHARKSARERAQVAESMWKLVARDLVNWHRKMERLMREAQAANEAGVEPILSPTDMAKLFDLGVKIERLEHGEPGAIEEQRHALTTDERRARLKELIEDPETRKAMKVISDRASRLLPKKVP